MSKYRHTFTCCACPDLPVFEVVGAEDARVVRHHLSRYHNIDPSERLRDGERISLPDRYDIEVKAQDGRVLGVNSTIGPPG